MPLRDLFGRRPAPAAEPDVPQDGPPRTPIGAASDRQRVTLQGVVESLQNRPHGSTSWLEVTLDDGTGQVVLTWMGRAHIPGIEAGRHLSVEGRLTAADGQLRLFNPRYTLL